MSLYNMLHGYNSNALTALAMLEKDPGDFGRFRDIWFDEDGKHIVVFTRCGGGNRESYQDMFDEFSKDPLFVEDWDDDFDCTYAYLKFNVPKKYLKMAERLKPKEPAPSLKEKTDAVCEAIGKTHNAQPIDVVEQLKNIIREAVESEKEEVKK